MSRRNRDTDPASLPYETLAARGQESLQLTTEIHDRLFQISHADWAADLDAQTITFTGPDGLVATAPVQVIGTYNLEDGTWLWAWANSSIDEALAADALRVCEYGERNGLEHLTSSKLEIEEDGCWELAGVALVLCQAQGAYCGPAGSTLVFVTFGEVTLSRPE